MNVKQTLLLANVTDAFNVMNMIYASNATINNVINTGKFLNSMKITINRIKIKENRE